MKLMKNTPRNKKLFISSSFALIMALMHALVFYIVFKNLNRLTHEKALESAIFISLFFGVAYFTYAMFFVKKSRDPFGLLD